MKKLVRRKNGLQGRLSIIFFLLAAVVANTMLSSCKKDDDAAAEPIVAGETSIRLIHSSFMQDPFEPGDAPIVTPVDLYVDGAKVNTGGSITFPDASAYFPLTNGERTIEVKDGAGNVIADTVITINDGRQYSFYLKDRSEINAANSAVIDPLERRLIPVADNNTAVPASGKAKVRFVNATSMPLNAAEGAVSFMTVTKTGNTAVTSLLTQNLGGDSDHVIFKSDFVSLDAGDVTFRAQSINGTVLNTTYVADLSTTLEAGKLYTVYVISTSETVKSVSKSPYALKIISTN